MGEETDASAPELVEEETVETIADDDPPTPTKNENFDFAVKEEYVMISEEMFAEFEQWEVVKTGKYTARKRRIERGRAFVPKSAGGTTTLRITTT